MTLVSIEPLSSEFDMTILPKPLFSPVRWALTVNDRRTLYVIIVPLLHVFYFSRVFFNVAFELIGENVFLFNYFRILRLRGPKAGLYVSINYSLLFTD